MFLVILLYALFACIFTLSKNALNYTQPFFFVGSRMLVAGLLLLAYQFFIKKKTIALNKTHLMYLVLLGITASFITNIAEIWATDHMLSSKVCLLYSLSPFLSALIAYIVLKEKLNVRQWIGLFIGFLGLLPITLTQTPTEILSGKWGLFSYPELAMLLAVICSVYGWILLKKIVQDFNYSPVMANGFSMTLGGALSLIFSYSIGENWNPIPVNNYIPFLEIAIAVGIISNIICYNLYGFLLKRFSATFMSFAGLITPVFASLFGWHWLKESISWHFYASLILFGIGLSVFYREESKSN
ncbi:MAG: hypothetical protein JWM09_505 [Francisellaceae bacterium]|nr:hypothetical protein [Francisellaceae bacterium]